MGKKVVNDTRNPLSLFVSLPCIIRPSVCVGNIETDKLTAIFAFDLCFQIMERSAMRSAMFAVLIPSSSLKSSKYGA